MIEAREIAATQREPRRQEMLVGHGPRLRWRSASRNWRTASPQVEASRDVAALASPQERAQWEALARIDATLAAMPAGPQRDEFAERARLLRGALSWELDRAYKLRAAQTRRDLRADASRAGRGRDATRRDRRGRRSRAAEHAGFRRPRRRTGGARRTHRSPDRRHGPRAGARARGPGGRRSCRRSRSASAVTRRRHSSRWPRCTTARRRGRPMSTPAISGSPLPACLRPAGPARPRARARRPSRRSGRSPAAVRRSIARSRCRRRRTMPRTVTRPSCRSTVRTRR